MNTTFSPENIAALLKAAGISNTATNDRPIVGNTGKALIRRFYQHEVPAKAVIVDGITFAELSMLDKDKKMNRRGKMVNNYPNVWSLTQNQASEAINKIESFPTKATKAEPVTTNATIPANLPPELQALLQSMVGNAAPIVPAGHTKDDKKAKKAAKKARKAARKALENSALPEMVETVSKKVAGTSVVTGEVILVDGEAYIVVTSPTGRKVLHRA